MLTVRNSLHHLNKLSDHNKLLVRSISSRSLFGAGMFFFMTLTMVTVAYSSFIIQASANCAYGGDCKADHHTATGDSNNPKSWKNTGTVDTRDKCFPHKQTCP